LGSDRESRPTADLEKIKSIIGVVEGKLGPELVINGDWTSPDGVRVNIDTALVPAAHALDAATAAATAPMHQAWLPTLTRYDNGEEEQRGSEMEPLEAWITNSETDYRFDRNDPYMSTDVMKRAGLAQSVAKSFGLTVDDTWRRFWTDANGKVRLSSRTWGARSGLEQRDDFESGQCLVCDKKMLRRMLKEKDRELLVLINLQHTKDYERYREMKDVERYTRTLVAVLIDAALNVRVVTPTEAQMKAVRKLGPRYSPDFDKRYAAIIRLKSRAPKKLASNKLKRKASTPRPPPTKRTR
jgi:hypothetical protein